ncbi:MAG: TlpA disulfide reductase family protein [Hyphomicrobiaceae bacterium]|nr:TlpA disulfide reductase family protein [Hyphomicrobiaceae bacterium]
MLTTSGCRAQPPAWRKRFPGGVLGSFLALVVVWLVIAPGRGLAERLVPWQGPVRQLPAATIDGAPLSLDDYRGRIVLVHFFATWCEPCGPELGALNRLHAELGERLSIVAIDVGEPRDRLQRFLDKNPISYPVALDADRAIARAWGVYALPSTFVLDRAHAAAWQALGDIDWSEPSVRARLTNPVSAPAEAAAP